MVAIGTTQKVRLQLRKGLAANINIAATISGSSASGYSAAQTGEPFYTTDTKKLYIFDGTNNIEISAGRCNVIVKTADYTATIGDDLIVCNKTTTMTITLPVATGSGKILYIKNINVGIVTVDGDSTDLIDGITNQILGQWDSITIIDYAANNWIIV